MVANPTHIHNTVDSYPIKATKKKKKILCNMEILHKFKNEITSVLVVL